jgi:hypothetical protein
MSAGEAAQQQRLGPQQWPAATPRQPITKGAAAADRPAAVPEFTMRQAAHHDRSCPDKMPDDWEDTHDR